MKTLFTNIQGANNYLLTIQYKLYNTFFTHMEIKGSK